MLGETLAETGLWASARAACLCPPPLVGSPPIFREAPPMPLLRFIPETTNVDFVKYRFVAFAIDGLLVVISILSIWLHGFSLGIDFTGGVMMQVKSAQVIDIRRI